MMHSLQERRRSGGRPGGLLLLLAAAGKAVLRQQTTTAAYLLFGNLVTLLRGSKSIYLTTGRTPSQTSFTPFFPGVSQFVINAGLPSLHSSSSSEAPLSHIPLAADHQPLLLWDARADADMFATAAPEQPYLAS